jgi:hypothetical protein
MDPDWQAVTWPARHLVLLNASAARFKKPHSSHLARPQTNITRAPAALLMLLMTMTILLMTNSCPAAPTIVAAQLAGRPTRHWHKDFSRNSSNIDMNR